MIVNGPACALCFTHQPKVKYDGAGMPICMSCLCDAVNAADDAAIVEAYTIALVNEAYFTVERLNDRLGW